MLGNQRAHCYNISVMCVSEKSLCQKIDELWFLSWSLLSWMSQFLVCLSVWLWLPSPNLRPMLSAELKTCPDPVSRRWDWARLRHSLWNFVPNDSEYLLILPAFSRRDIYFFSIIDKQKCKCTMCWDLEYSSSRIIRNAPKELCWLQWHHSLAGQAGLPGNGIN